MSKSTRHTRQLPQARLLVILAAIALAIAAAGCDREAEEPVRAPSEPTRAPDTERVEAPPDTGIPSNYVLLENPLLHDERSQRVGRTTYDEYCAGCHGPTGKGDGPKAAGLAHKPAVLSSPQLATEAGDAYLFWRISEGIPDGDMPGFKRKLGGQQRWYLVNHIRAFLSPPPASGERPGRREAGERAGPHPAGRGPRGGEGGPGAREGGPRRGPGGPGAREGGPRRGPGGPGAREGRPAERPPE